MWLLNAFTRNLEFFEGNDIPKYAILSHRWEDDEVSFDDVKRGQAHVREGYRKLDFCCKEAMKLSDGFGRVYVWIDTCCIDKSNSAELSEAINSMYVWYSNAVKCFAFISDVADQSKLQFRKSLWFTRGWTLQELLAPKVVEFFDHDWRPLGTRHELREVLARITGISQNAFAGEFRPSEYSVANKMSWVAKRQTKRREDMAYCMIGLFEVNMPMIYGEGDRAFARLQEEIIRKAADLTIFAWPRSLENTTPGLLAKSPVFFGYGNQTVKSFEIPDELVDRLGEAAEQPHVHSLSSIGLDMTLYLIPLFHGVYLTPVAYTYDPVTNCPHYMGMMIERWGPVGRFTRISVAQQTLFDLPSAWSSMGQLRRLIVVNDQVINYASSTRGDHFDNRESYSMLLHEIEVRGVSDSRYADILSRNAPEVHSRKLALHKWTYGLAGIVRVAVPELPLVFFLLGYDFDFNPFCLVVLPHRSSDENDNLEAMEISLPNLQMYRLCLTDNGDVMKLVAALKQGYRKSGDAGQDRAELHLASWKVQQAEFEVAGIGTVTVSKQSSKVACHRISIKVFDLADMAMTLTETADDACSDQEKQTWFTHPWRRVRRYG